MKHADYFVKKGWISQNECNFLAYVALGLLIVNNPEIDAEPSGGKKTMAETLTINEMDAWIWYNDRKTLTTGVVRIPHDNKRITNYYRNKRYFEGSMNLRRELLQLRNDINDLKRRIEEVKI